MNHGNLGQTFLYGVKGDEIFILLSPTGRPLSNAVDKHLAGINGTCPCYQAESFLGGDPHLGEWFVILNGAGYTEDRILFSLPSPDPGGKLFCSASGGAIFVRAPPDGGGRST